MKLLRVFFALPLLFVTCLSGCASNTVDGITTVTINVATIDAWATALNNSTNLILSLSGVGATPAGVAILAVGDSLAADIKAFDAATKGQTTLTLNGTAVPAALASLEADANTLLANVKTAVGGVAATDVATAQNYLSAIETVVSLVEASVPSLTVGAPLRAAPRMSEAQALAVLSKK